MFNPKATISTVSVITMRYVAKYQFHKQEIDILFPDVHNLLHADIQPNLQICPQIYIRSYVFRSTNSNNPTRGRNWILHRFF